MIRDRTSAPSTPRLRGVSGTLREALVVALAGLVLALLANGLSPRGLSLRRDYFPPAPTVGSGAAAPRTSGAGQVREVGVIQAGATNPPGPATAIPAVPPAVPASAGSGAANLPGRLAARGLRLVETAEARRLFEDPRRVQELVVFVDARNEAHYAEGHVPGAYLFDRYYPENHLPTVIPACQSAEQVVVYCLGGECEDSELAAVALMEAGIPADRLGVYAGGMTDWAAASMPVEIGERGSGRMREGAK